MAAAAKKKARVTRAFYDIKAKVNRKQGEVFECTAARFKEIAEAYPSEPLVVEDGKAAEDPKVTEAA